MEELHGIRRSLAKALEGIGFNVSDGGAEALDGHVNLVRALLCAGLYPNVARIRLPDTKYTPTAQGAVESVNDDARGGGTARGSGRTVVNAVPVVFDGGVRRGSDVLKALALTRYKVNTLFNMISTSIHT